jgi:threonylcarbamoyladenosine tRNA methylthiotransferase MtaB
MELTFLHVFPYSERPGTPAARMPQLPVPLRRERAARLRAAGQASADRFYATRLEAARTGQEEAVLFEREDRGHTAHFAPLRLLGGIAAPGELRRIRVTGADAQGLLAEVAPLKARMGQV